MKTSLVILQVFFRHVPLSQLTKYRLLKVVKKQKDDEKVVYDLKHTVCVVVGDDRCVQFRPLTDWVDEGTRGTTQ